MLKPHRKQELSELADDVSNEYFFDEVVSPEGIAFESEITYSYGNYANAFDGLIEHRSGLFHIYINLDRLNEPTAARTRFTFAHELGHYFIDSHRNALLSGRTPSHPSFNKMNRNPVEREADYFASCLLMPEKYFQAFCKGQEFTPALLDGLCDRFQTSRTTTVYKFAELNISPIGIVLSRNGQVISSQTSEKFWNGNLPRYKDAVPRSTAAGEYFSRGIKYETAQIVTGGDWFTGRGMNAHIEYFEKCYYQHNNTVLSILWRL